MTVNAPPSSSASSSGGVASPLKRLGALVGVALVVALMTGPPGDSPTPLNGVKGSIFDPRVFLFLGGAVVLWAISLLYDRFSPQVREVRSSVSSAGARAFAKPGSKQVTYLLLLVIAILVPLQLSPAAQQSAVTDVGIYALLALGLNVVIGYAGLLDLGYIAFYAIGAYTTAYFTSDSALPVHSTLLFNPFAVFPIALAIAAFAGILLGGPTLRLRGDYLAIVTLGFGEIVQKVANNADGFTNGSRGAFGVPKLSIHVGPINYDWGIDPLPYYYVLLVLIVLVMLAFSALERSRIGRGLAAIREDEVAAEATGVPTLRYKLLAFAIGASTSGIAGVIFATKQFFNPQTFSLQASLLVLTVVIFGGMGSLFGVVLGAIVIQGTFFILRDVVPPNDRYIYFGALVMVMMVFRPQGLLPSRRRSQEIALVESGGASTEMLGSGSAVER
jgi:branched-chain amino acid transport system permease protein